MPFSAINTYEQELRQRNERHTLELQLEQAMQTYQSALEAQRVGNFYGAHELYVKLFAFDVVSSGRMAANSADGLDSTNLGSQQEAATNTSAKSLQLGPAIRLRAMALKNFALLLLSDEDVEAASINEALSCLIEALHLVGSDDKEKLVIPSLVQVTWALGFHRLARLGLEVLVQNNEKSALQPLEEWQKSKTKTGVLFGPRTIDNLKALDYMIALDEGTMKDINGCPQLLKGYSNLAEARKKQPSLIALLESESKIELSLPSKSWESLVASITNALNSSARRGKRKAPMDTYSWSSKDLWNVQFTGITLPSIWNSDGEAMSNVNGEEQDEAPEKTAVATDVETMKDNSVVSQALSPRYDSTPPPSGTVNASSPATPVPEKANTPLLSGEGTNSLEKETENDYDRAETQFSLAVHASPVKRRRTDRVKRSALALPADFGIIDNNFAAQFNLFLSLVNSEERLAFESPAPLFLDPTQIPGSQLAGAMRLRDLLSSWDTRESNQFLLEAADNKPQKGGVMATLRKSNTSASLNGNDEQEHEDDSENSDFLDESSLIDQFVAGNNGLHMQQIRWNLARELLGRLTSSSQSRSFGQMVYNFVSDIEPLLWSRRRFLRAHESTSIFALFADKWIRERTQDLEPRMVRWQFVSSVSPSLPHSWITAFVEQEGENTDPESSVVQFECILHELQNTGSEKSSSSAYFDSLSANLREIPPLNVANTQMQISKFKAAAAFERVLKPPPSMDSTEASINQNAEDIILLEAMLMPKTHEKPDSTSDTEFNAIQSFLEYAQPQFKMGLWYILLEKYEANGSATDSLTGLTQIFMEAIKSYECGEPLLQSLSIAHDVGKRLVPLFERHPDILSKEWSRDEALGLLGAIIKLLQTLHLFLLYDDAINSNLLQKPITTSWPQAQSKFRELVVMWWCIFYRFWLRCLPDALVNASETINDILSIVHERLGNLGYCGVAERCLLNLHLSEIARINWEGSTLDLSQCMKCKFGLNLSLYGDTANHHTVSVPLEAKDAALLLPFVMRMILNHRNFNQVVMRMDTRAVIEAFANAYENESPDKFKRREENLRAYLESDFNLKSLQRAWVGRADSKLLFQDGDDGHGLWIVQAGILMNQYRMRRRQAYAASSLRTENLEVAISLFVNDLCARPTRFESWLGMAQAYAYICEDCLTFGYDLAVEYEPEQYCRRGLLAASFAISLLVGDSASQRPISIAHKESLETLKKTIWPLFGYLLILAVTPPLSGAPFSTGTKPVRPLLIELPDTETLRLGVQRIDSLDDQIALRTAIKCLSEPADAQQEWINAMHQCMAALRLNLSVKKVLSYAEKARSLSPNGTLDAEVELTHVVWQFYRQKLLSTEDALTTLKALSAYSDAIKSVDTNSSSFIEELIERCFRWFIGKNKWLHRPHYFLAKIYELDRKDTKAAQEELMHLFTLKSPTKPLVIWKTDSDLPGQHAVYVTQYVKYMTDLMFENEDSSGLLLMARRFRRAGTEMWNHFATYEYIYGQTSLLVRKFLQLQSAQKSKYSDTLMGEVSDNAERFEERVKAMSATFESPVKQNNGWLQALLYVMELRRVHSGPGTIAQADELLIIIFLTMLKKYVPPESWTARGSTADPAAPTNENNSVISNLNAEPQKKPEKQSKRLIRKDIIQAAQQFLKPFQQLLGKNDDITMPRNLEGSHQ